MSTANFASTFSSSTAVIPIHWRGKVVHKAKVNLELAEILTSRSWHISSTQRPQSPRTSFVLGSRTHNIWLHRTVVALSIRENKEDALALFNSLEELVPATTALPQISFFNEDCFDCRVLNLKLYGLGVKVADLEFSFFPSHSELPASALVKRKRKESSVELLSEESSQILEPHTQLEPLEIEKLEDSNHLAIKDVFDILGGEK